MASYAAVTQATPPVGIHDLPNEVLLRIFELLEGFEVNRPTQYRLANANSPKTILWSARRDKTSIMNSRLVCRRFHDLSSQFLIRIIRVTPDIESLNRLEEISRHPTLSKGVTDVWLALNFHSPSLDNLQRFTSYLLCVLDQSILEMARGPFAPYYLPPPHPDAGASFCSFADHLRRILPLTATTPNNTRAAKRSESSEDPDLERLRQVFAKYQDIMDTEKVLILGPGRFCPRVAEAMARMPLARNLMMDDLATDIRSGSVASGHVADRLERLEFALIRDRGPYRELTWDYLEQYMLRAIVDGSGDVLPPDYAYKSIVSMLSSLQTSSVLLRGLELKLAHPTYHAQLNPANAAAGDREQLTASMQRLKHFSFAYEGINRNRNGDDPADVDGLHQFLAAILDTSSLEEVHFRPVSDGIPVEDPGMMGMVDLTKAMGTTRSRKRLETLDLNWVVADVEELRIILSDCLPPLLKSITLSEVSLLVEGDRDRAIHEGAWRDLLDQLREKKPTWARVTDPNGPMAMDWHISVLYTRIFGENDRFIHPAFPESLGRSWVNKATQYILSGARGYDFPNPFGLFIVPQFPPGVHHLHGMF